MVAKNEITGDNIQSRGTSNSYRNNYDNIFRKKKAEDITDIEKNKEVLDTREVSNEEGEV